jgi:RimJ/RimL family protein N-acetyltransferase
VPDIDAPESRMSDGVVSLAPFALADVETVMKWDADRDVQRWYDWPLTPAWDDAATYAARRANAERVVREQPAAWQAGTQLAFVIHAADTGEGLGWIDLQPRGQGRGNVAYGVLAEHRRKGAATRSVRLACRYAFDVLQWARVEIRAIADNVASRRVAESCGFQLEGVLRSYGVYERHEPVVGQRFDEVIYGRLRAE